MIPKISIEEGWTTLEAIVKLTEGICLRTSADIIKKCREYPKKIYFKRDISINDPGYSKEDYDAKDILDVLAMSASYGTRMKVFVEGTDECAERHAFMLYSAATSSDSYNPYFNRYEFLYNAP